MHPESINQKTSLVFEKIAKSGLASKFYLAGGTALAIQLGHRESIDLDFFSQENFSHAELKNKLPESGKFYLSGEEEGTLHGALDEVKSSFLKYSYDLMYPFLDFEGIKIADERDIAAMKIDAISSRGSKKDFIDLYFLLEKYNYIKNVEEECHDAASALVASKDYKNKLVILLLHHRKIGKWIPIGGHVERFESPESAVIRELEEEIGISPIYWFDKNSRSWSSLPVLFGEKLEKIPAPDGKAIHFHRDFIFVAIIDCHLEESFIGESAGRLKWFTLEDILKLSPDETTPETLELIKELEKFQKELLG